MAFITGLWEALYSSIGDTMWEVAGGRLLVRTTALHPVGTTTLAVESTDRFPAAGDIALDGRVYAYTSKTATTFVGLAERLGPVTLNATVGLLEESQPYSVVIDETRSETQLDKLRRAFFVLYAEGEDLTVLGANYGVPRPRDLTDTTYRALLREMIAIEAGTIYAIEKVLEVLEPGNWTLWERTAEIDERFKIFVGIGASLAASSAGKGFVAGLEAQPRITATTVDVDQPALLAYGVYDATDYLREGTNYAMLTSPSPGSTNSVNPTWFQDTPSNPFLTTDVGSPIILHFVNDSGDTQHWKVVTRLSPSTITLGWDSRTDGRIDVAVNNQRFITTSKWFAPWVGRGAASNEGSSLVIVGGLNAGTYPIEGYISETEIEIGGTFTATETGVTWYIEPNYQATLNVEYELFRASVAGNTVTTPENMPVNVLVDYTNVRSAEALLDANVDGTSQHPLYLFDPVGTVRTVLDLIRPAGTTIEAEITT